MLVLMVGLPAWAQSVSRESAVIDQTYPDLGLEMMPDQEGSVWAVGPERPAVDLSHDFQGGRYVFSFLVLLLLLLVPLLLGILLAVYVYTSLAYMNLARRIGVQPAWLAWIPIANLYLISKMAGMHWWPALLLLLLPVPLINIMAMVALLIFFFFWHVRIFAKAGRPEWWALSLMLPGAGTVLFYVLLGLAAWGGKKPRPTRDLPLNPHSDI